MSAAAVQTHCHDFTVGCHYWERKEVFLARWQDGRAVGDWIPRADTGVEWSVPLPSPSPPFPSPVEASI